MTIQGYPRKKEPVGIVSADLSLFEDWMPQRHENQKKIKSDG